MHRERVCETTQDQLDDLGFTLFLPKAGSTFQDSAQISKNVSGRLSENKSSCFSNNREENLSIACLISLLKMTWARWCMPVNLRFEWFEDQAVKVILVTQ